MEHIDKRSHSNDSLTSETIQKVRLVASDTANGSKTIGPICGGRCDHHRLQKFGSESCSNLGSGSPSKAANSSGSLDGLLKGDSNVGGAGCSTGKVSCMDSGHGNGERSADYSIGYKEGYAQGLQSGFQAGYEEARKELRKADKMNTTSKKLGILAGDNKSDDVSSAQSSSSAEEDKAAASVQQNASCISNGDSVSSSVSNSSSELSSTLSSVSSVSSEAQFPGVCTDQPQQEKFRKQPSSSQEQLLAKYTTEVFHQPPSSGVLRAPSGDNKASAPADCSICMSNVAEASPYQTDQDASRDLVGCVALKLCGHHFHTSCLKQMASHNTTCLTCPNCQTIHGVRTGTQPIGGMMAVQEIYQSLPGFPNCRTYQITYSIPHGVQGPEHPNPGRPYHLAGFPRIAYIPATIEGDRVLKLLRLAFDRRLIFTVGTSATSGSSDCVVWNGIHHKTETRNIYGHGYPDPKYLGNVLLELASFGVTD